MIKRNFDLEVYLKKIYLLAFFIFSLNFSFSQVQKIPLDSIFLLTYDQVDNNPIYYLPRLKATYQKLKETDGDSKVKHLYQLLELSSGVYYALSDYKASLRTAQEQLKIALKTKDSSQLYRAYQSLGIAEFHMENIDASIGYLKKATAFASDDSERIQNLANLGAMIEDSATKFKYLNRAYDEVQLVNHDDLKLYVMGQMRNAFAENDRINEAISMALEIEKSPVLGKDLQESIWNNMILAEAYYELGKEQEAYKKVTKAFGLAKYTGAPRSIAETIGVLADIYKGIGMLDSAFYCLKREAEINDSLFSVEQGIRFQNLRTSLDLERKELEIKLLEENASVLQENERLAITSKWLAITVLSIILLGLRWFYKSRSKRLVGERHKLELEAENLRLSQTQLEQELELKKKRLADMLLLQTERMELIEELNKKVKEFKGLEDQSVKEITEKLIDQQTKKDVWNEFKMHFTEVHEGFFDRLKRRSLELTTKDIKFCAYARMNLTTKEIADMLALSPRTVEGIRRRVRKKLGLNSDEDIVLFLMGL